MINIYIKSVRIINIIEIGDLKIKILNTIYSYISITRFKFVHEKK